MQALIKFSTGNPFLRESKAVSQKFCCILIGASLRLLKQMWKIENIGETKGFNAKKAQIK